MLIYCWIERKKRKVMKVIDDDFPLAVVRGCTFRFRHAVKHNDGSGLHGGLWMWIMRCVIGIRLLPSVTACGSPLNYYIWTHFDNTGSWTTNIAEGWHTIYWVQWHRQLMASFGCVWRCTYHHNVLYFTCCQKVWCMFRVSSFGQYVHFSRWILLRISHNGLMRK